MRGVPINPSDEVMYLAIMLGRKNLLPLRDRLCSPRSQLQDPAQRMNFIILSPPALSSQRGA